MRKGFTIPEMFGVIVLLAFATLWFGPVFAILLRDIPRSYRLVQEHTTMLNILQQMRSDIETAKALTESSGQLLAEGPDGVVCYRLSDGKAVRSKQNSAASGNIEDETIWSVPHAKIRWAVWKKNDKGYAAEVEAYLEYYAGENLQKKMANSHLYFVGARQK